jgi:hypothetical protein
MKVFSAVEVSRLSRGHKREKNQRILFGFTSQCLVSWIIGNRPTTDLSVVVQFEPARWDSGACCRDFWGQE